VNAVGRTVRVPHAVSSAAAVRHAVAAELAEGSVPARVVADVALLVSELVANAVRHARPLPDDQIEVHWSVGDDSIRTRVTDGGAATMPRVLAPGLEAVSGRGLSIVDKLAAKWGVDTGEGRTTVWVVVPFNHLPDRAG